MKTAAGPRIFPRPAAEFALIQLDRPAEEAGGEVPQLPPQFRLTHVSLLGERTGPQPARCRCLSFSGGRRAPLFPERPHALRNASVPWGSATSSLRRPLCV